jgi:hypothetical protein
MLGLRGAVEHGPDNPGVAQQFHGANDIFPARTALVDD